MAENQGHPAWQEILDVLPEEFHGLIKPQLAKWDKGVQDKLTEVREQYAPYKEFIDNNVPAETLKNAYGLLNEFQTDPESVVKQAIEAFELDFVDPETHANAVAQAQAAAAGDDDGLDLGDGTDFSSLENHPQFKQLMTMVEGLQGTLTEKQKEDQAKAEQEALDNTLAKLQEDKGDFDKVYVMTLMANGMTGEKAVEQYQTTINQATEAKLKEQGITLSGGQSDTPIVMNGGGDAGSGVAADPVDLGQLKNNELNDMVVELLSQSDNSGN